MSNFSIHDHEVRLFIILIIALIFLFLVSVIFSSEKKRKDLSVPSGIVLAPFKPVAIKAKAAYVYDLRTRTVLFAKEEDRRLPLASLTKIMAALVAQELNPFYSVIKVDDEALMAEGDSGLLKGEKWSLENILDFSLVASSNDGMRAVALSLGALSKAGATSDEIINDFVKEMNRKASELGLKNTYFWNETGLDRSDVKGGAYGSAKDVNSLMVYALLKHPDMFRATTESRVTIRSLDNHNHTARNTNNLVNEIPGILASKTGLTETAGGNLTFAFDPELGRPIIVSILGSTEFGRFEDARILVGAVMAYIGNHQ